MLVMRERERESERERVYMAVLCNNWPMSTVFLIIELLKLQ